MDVNLNRNRVVKFIIPFLYIVLFTSLFFSFRAITSICIGLLLISGIFLQIQFRGSLSLNRSGKLLLGSCALYFLLQVVSALFASDQALAWKDVQLKSGILLIPLSVFLAGSQQKNLILRSYCALLAAALLYCLYIAISHSFANNDTSYFFYHQFVRPLKQHAVYMAIFVFIALMILLEKIRKKEFLFIPVLQFLFIAFYSGCLVLLASKLVLFVYLLSLVYFLFSFLKISVPEKKLSIILATGVLVIITGVLVTRNPISSRFRDMFTGDPGLAQQDVFHPGIYFNGIQFRLLQIRLVPGILSKENKWLTGVGPAKAQSLLDREYTTRNMYLGEPSRGDKGYLGYNTHNQFLESLLKHGIPGLLFFLFIFVVLLGIAWQNRKTGAFFIVFILLLYACIESVFETQYGIILFTLFPAFICLNKETTNSR